MRTPSIDRQLLLASVALIAFGLLTLYSAGQTDVPTRAAGVWIRQFVWVGIGMIKDLGGKSQESVARGSAVDYVKSRVPASEC